jgi:NADPH2:quinone reductase
MAAESALPKTMQAAVIDRAGPPDALRMTEVPVPPLARDHVVIALEYASVGPWDTHTRAGNWGPVKRGTILGVDGSGTIVRVAADVKGLRVGDRVYAYSYGNKSGGFYAEYVSVPANRVAPVPAHLDMKVAGAMPCVALTALSGLDTLEAKRGQTMLVFGASGGVGSLAVWLASTRGVTVIGTARREAQEYVRTMGAAHVVDPGSSERERTLTHEAPGGLDAALVTASGDALMGLLSHLRLGCPFAYPNGVEPQPKVDGHKGLTFDGEMTHAAFEHLNAAIGERTMPLRTEVFALADVADAHRRVERGHVDGKVVLRIH